ncbi:hypothetical protein [Yoonia sediminilitoris]|uniref:Uncharacterized protein n=1 Tax=Yoonia sediminilitoris TaxID=1286148 RepID=A0A2T6KN04_9RHOB|nr:hypothetical protein [Yoonia sediminilitoris]PUB17561.1 hypothetical protein C8N45_102573 [Yoonia sediminilitoris]RCW97856.1 hypothetical protein DFP92_102573 [Yoonia sediminilitoris]
MVVDDLDALQGKFEGIETVAFADLSTQMILVTNSNSNQRREALEMLCAEATVALGSADKPALGDTPSPAAFVATKNQLRIFLRAPGEPSDVLCCVCKPDVDVASFLSDAKPCLAKISSGT